MECLAEHVLTVTSERLSVPKSAESHRRVIARFLLRRWLPDWRLFCGFMCRSKPQGWLVFLERHEIGSWLGIGTGMWQRSITANMCSSGGIATTTARQSLNISRILSLMPT